MKDKSKFFSNVFFVSIFIILYFIIFPPLATIFSISEIILFTFNYVFCVFALVMENKNYSLYKMSYIFIIIFMVIAPIMQISSGYAPWGMVLTENEILTANIIVLVFSIFYFVTYKLYSKGNSVNNIKFTALPNEKNFFYFLSMCSIISALVLIKISGLEALFIRSDGLYDLTAGSSSNSANNAITFFIISIVRSIPVVSLGIFLLSIKYKRFPFSTFKKYLFVMLLILLVIITNFPVNISRFQTAAVYIGLLILVTSYKFWDGKKFDYLILFAITIIFPIFQLYKYYSFSESLIYIPEALSKGFNSVDYDAFTLLAKTGTFIQNYGLQMGNQIRSGIFFFVPRFILNIKGDSSGQVIAVSNGLSYTNLSEPIMAEGYIDFGYVGVILYAIICALVCKKIDNGINNVKKIPLFVEIIVAFSLGFVIFNYRGALANTIIRTMGFFLFIGLIYLCKKLIGNRERNR